MTERVEFYCESFENGRKIGGFSFRALNLPEALLMAARHGEVLIRPHITDLRVRTLAEAKAQRDQETREWEQCWSITTMRSASGAAGNIA
jgi:hypothetical protein